MISLPARFAAVLVMLPAAALISLSGCRPTPPTPAESGPQETSQTPTPAVVVQSPPATPVTTPEPVLEPTPEKPRAAEKLEIATEPMQAIAGRLFDPAPSVRITDSSGNPVPGALVSVAISKHAFASASQTQTSTDADGVAVFSNLSMETAGSFYRLAFTVEGCPPVESAEFNIRFAPPRTLTVATQPGSSRAGAAISGPPSVLLVDSFGNPVPRIAVEARFQEPAKGTLSGTTRVQTNENGVAEFDKLISKSGAAQAVLLFDAKAAGVPDAVSEGFSVR